MSSPEHQADRTYECRLCPRQPRYSPFLSWLQPRIGSSMYIASIPNRPFCCLRDEDPLDKAHYETSQGMFVRQSFGRISKRNESLIHKKMLGYVPYPVQRS